jgi:hypothetical protein
VKERKMRIRMLRRPDDETFDDALCRVRRCIACAEKFLVSMRLGDVPGKLEAQREISRQMKPGIYRIRNLCESVCCVYGVRHDKKVKTDPERAFLVLFETTAGMERLPLIDFLSPIVRDGYRGPRAVRIAEILDR